MRKLKFVFFTAMFTAITVGYTNCGNYQVSSKFKSSREPELCISPETKENFLKTAPLNTTCEQALTYSCERRIFRPDTINRTDVIEECFDAIGGGQVCLHVVHRTYSTAALLETEDRREFEPGGDYNREEIRCTNDRLLLGQRSILSSEGETIQEAFDDVYRQCHEALHAQIITSRRKK